MFFISFEKGFKIKSQVANEYLFVFFDIERKRLEVKLSVCLVMHWRELILIKLILL